MLTQTEARPAAGDVLKHWPIETSDQRPSTYVSAEEFHEALHQVYRIALFRLEEAFST